MTERDSRLLELARLLYEGEARERDLISPNILWHVPGHNPVSGEYRGTKEYFETMVSRMAPLSRWDFTLLGVMVNGNYIVSQFRTVGERKGNVINTAGSHILRFDESDQIVEGWGFAEDQDGLDAFFSA